MFYEDSQLQNIIYTWLNEQVLTLSDEPPKFILQQNKAIGPNKYYLLSKEDIDGNIIADYEIIEKFLYCRLRQYNDGWKFESACIYIEDNYINSSFNLPILIFLSNIFFNNNIFGECYLIYCNIIENKLTKQTIELLKEVAAKKDGQADTIVKFHKLEKNIPEYILTTDKEIFDNITHWVKPLVN